MSNWKGILKTPSFYWSASKYKFWQECNKCFWLKYIEKLPAPKEEKAIFAYGSFLHNAIETGEADFEELREKLGDLHTEAAKKHLDIIKSKPEIIPKDRVVHEVEFLVELDIPNPVKPKKNLFLFGFLDGVEYDEKSESMPVAYQATLGKSGYHIVAYDKDKKVCKDYKPKKIIEIKTSSAPYSYNHIATDYQFDLYKFATKAIFDRDIFMQLLVFHKKNPNLQIAKINRTQSELDKFIAKTKEAVTRIQNKEISPISTCPFYSDYIDICKEYEL